MTKAFYIYKYIYRERDRQKDRETEREHCHPARKKHDVRVGKPKKEKKCSI